MNNKNITEMSEDDYDDEENEIYEGDKILPKEFPSFQSMKASTLEALSKYKARQSPEKVSK